MRLLLIFAACFGLSSQSAVAQTYEGCSGREQVIIDAALRSAKDLSLRAAVAVGDTAEYQRWFGAYSPRNADVVRAHLKSIVAALRTGGVTAQCEAQDSDGCRAGEYAYVFANVPYRMHMCPSFFDLPRMRSKSGNKIYLNADSLLLNLLGDADDKFERGVNTPEKKGWMGR